ncbi:hypothetical protein OG879_19905 [Streptomyces caniferus]|nr:hypothetical protein [Streptomyces caniferus]
MPNPAQTRALLGAVRDQGKRGEHPHGFFGCMYYAAMHPSEVAQLSKRDCKLPASTWDELILERSRPEVGSGWTDDGKSYELRGLKRRARKTTRPVPIPPVLVAEALSDEDTESPLAEVPYSLRHAGVSLWIKAGVDPVEVARRAGHSIAVLWKFYAKILRGQEHRANQLIDDALGVSEESATPE